MKFGSWTYDGYTIDLRHIHEKEDDPVIPMGMDLSGFYLSVEWDVIAVPARRKVIFYSCCEEPYIDITFNITLRRKTLFYTFNLIIPCVAISFLSILVFYLPSDSGEKVSLSIMIMLSLVVFFLLLAEIIPPTSLAVPLLGKYLLFTMVLITFSSMATIAVMNINYRSPATHRMPPWIRKVFIDFLPKYLCMQRPKNDDNDDEQNCMEDQYSCNFENQLISKNDARRTSLNSIDSNDFEVTKCARAVERLEDKDLAAAEEMGRFLGSENEELNSDDNQESPMEEGSLQVSAELRRVTTRIQFLSQHKKNLDSYLQIEEDWKYVAMVLDRILLWLFTFACIGGTVVIILRAPTLYTPFQPIDVLLTKVTQ